MRVSLIPVFLSYGRDYVSKKAGGRGQEAGLNRLYTLNPTPQSQPSLSLLLKIGIKFQLSDS